MPHYLARIGPFRNSEHPVDAAVLVGAVEHFLVECGVTGMDAQPRFLVRDIVIDLLHGEAHVYVEMEEDSLLERTSRTKVHPEGA